MFDKRKDSSTEPSVAVSISEASSQPVTSEAFNTRSAALIGATIKIKGSISGDENLVIEGKVEGSVELAGHDLTVGQKGQVDADLKAKTIKVEGQVTGDIAGSEKVIITKAGRVLGNIVAPRVTLEDGAKFKGSIDMDPGIEATASAASPKRTASIGNTEVPKEKDAKATG